MAKTQSAVSTKKAAKPVTKASASKGPTKSQKAKAEKLFGKEAVLEQPTAQPAPEQVQEERRAGQDRRNNAMTFALQQLSVPQAPATPAPALSAPPQATEEFQKALADLQAKFGIAVAPVSTPKPKADKVVQNGITRPNPSTLCGKIWAAADQISQATHGVAPISLLKEHPDVKGTNEHTIKTQYARWRAFNGVTGRLPKIPAVHQEAAPWNKPTPDDAEDNISAS